MKTKHEILTEMGWYVACEHPYEIEHTESGSRASGIAAKIVVDYLVEEYTSENYNNEGA